MGYSVVRAAYTLLVHVKGNDLTGSGLGERHNLQH